jgi:hypothetical protein
MGKWPTMRKFSIPARAAAAAACLLAATGVLWAATSMKDPLYGDPAHPNISGMWNPEFVYFGAPLAGAAPAGPPAGGPTAGARGAGAGAPGGGGPPAGMRFTRPAPPKLKPVYAERYAKWRKALETGTQEPDSVARCLAFGVVRFGTMPMEILQTPGQITMNLGVLHDIRRIYMDGIGHTVGADPSFNGDSVGHWDGDTLVVETNNLRAGTIDREGVPYSDQLTVVERIKRTSPTRLEIQTTMTDPEALEEPYVIQRAYTPMPPGSRFEEYLCENNRDDH